jgi:membrane-bound lytic murein transglycosylase D
MKKMWLAAALLLSMFRAPAQDATLNLDDLVQWANENLDANTLSALQSADQDKIKQLFEDFQRRYQGEYVIDLASLKDAARALLPLLEGNEDTKPYAAWLKVQLDYLEVADQFRLMIPPPKVQTNQPPQPVFNPAPEKERDIWIRKLSERPLPEAAKPYVARLKAIFIAQNVPPELIWLAEVESGFDPKARSPAGAAGMFQLMPATAEHYGLRVSRLFSVLDQRLDPDLSGRAAAKYLAYLYGQFKDWRLVLAAYNSGEGTVRRLLERYRAKTFDGIATHLPAETQMYVPRIEAVILLREKARLDQLRLPGAQSSSSARP